MLDVTKGSRGAVSEPGCGHQFLRTVNTSFRFSRQHIVQMKGVNNRHHIVQIRGGTDSS